MMMMMLMRCVNSLYDINFHERLQCCHNLSQDVCETSIETRGGRQLITKQCQQPARCLDKLVANTFNCSDDSTPSLCQFCCASATCNSDQNYPGESFKSRLGIGKVLTLLLLGSQTPLFERFPDKMSCFFRTDHALHLFVVLGVFCMFEM